MRNFLRLLGCYGGEMVGRGLAKGAPREKTPPYANAGAPHHQGSASLSKYKNTYVSRHHLSNLAAFNSN
jgi:hypothetical protein